MGDAVHTAIALGIDPLTFGFSFVIEIKPCINPAVLDARDLLSFWFASFVKNPSIRLPIKINVLFDPFHLAVFVVIDPEVNFPIPVGILLLTNDMPLLIIIEACYYTWRQLASGEIIHK